MITNTRYGIAGGQWQGLSTDTKPQDADINDLFLELDTGDFYYFDGSTWSKVGG